MIIYLYFYCIKNIYYIITVILFYLYNIYVHIYNCIICYVKLPCINYVLHYSLLLCLFWTTSFIYSKLATKHTTVTEHDAGV